MWKLIITDRFSDEFKRYKKNKEFIDALEDKIKRLQEDPKSVGGYLSERLSGYQSTRLLKNFRILFKTIENEGKVYIIAIDRRKHDYKNF